MQLRSDNYTTVLRESLYNTMCWLHPCRAFFIHYFVGWNIKYLNEQVIKYRVYLAAKCAQVSDIELLILSIHTIKFTTLFHPIENWAEIYNISQRLWHWHLNDNLTHWSTPILVKISKKKCLKTKIHWYPRVFWNPLNIPDTSPQQISFYQIVPDTLQPSTYVHSL